MDSLVDGLVKGLAEIMFEMTGFLLFILLIIWVVKGIRRAFRGNIGEEVVSSSLKKLSEESYKIINDVLIEVNGITHQIDHIVVSKYGIFVIETKCYDGMIVGKEKDYYWYQYLGKERFKLKNPIHQNYGHIKALSEALKINEGDMISIVCFTNQSKLKLETKSVVVHRNDLVEKILELSSNEKNLDYISIFNRINEINIVDKEKRKSHIEYANSKKEETEDKENNMICPKCGGNLVERNGKYGTFIGCSNYPKCKYTKK